MKMRTLVAASAALGIASLANAFYAGGGFAIPDNAPGFKQHRHH